MTDLVTESLVGATVTFRSKNTSDLITYTGEVIAVGNYLMAQRYMDIATYNANVQRADGSVGDYNTLDYFLIEMTPDSTTSGASGNTTIVPFADAWISSGSFSVITQDTIYVINVYSSSSGDPTNLLNLLKANNYKVILANTISPSV